MLEEDRDRVSGVSWRHIYVIMVVLAFLCCAFIAIGDYRDLKFTEEQVTEALNLAKLISKKQKAYITDLEEEIDTLIEHRRKLIDSLKNKEESQRRLLEYLGRIGKLDEFSAVEDLVDTDYFLEEIELLKNPEKMRDDPHLKILGEISQKVSDKLQEIENRDKVKVVIYAPQPRTNRRGIKQSLYPHQVYDFWWQKVKSLDGDWAEWDCEGVKCLFSSDKSRENVKHADGVVFFFPRSFRNVTERNEILDSIAPKQQHQKYILVNIEPNVIEHELLTNETPLDHGLDMTVYVSKKSDVQINYFGTYSNYTIHSLFKPAPSKKPLDSWNITSPILYLSSNCKKERDSFVQELQNYIPVDSYGACLHNKDFSDDLKEMEGGVGSHGWRVKEELLRRYKFVLAFENNMFEDYVSEKFYQPLIHGCVPIYLGAPNVDDYTLFPNSIIRANAFKSKEQLAEYIKILDKNDKLYQEFFSWKRYGITPQLTKASYKALYSAPCRLCQAIQNKR